VTTNDLPRVSNPPLLSKTSAPFAPATAAELDQLRAALRQPPAEPPRVEGQDPWLTVHNDSHALLRTYLLGVLDSRLGDTLAARRAARELDSLGNRPEARVLARTLATALTVDVGSRAGSGASSALAPGEMRLEVPLELASVSPFYSLARERFIRAGQLESAGRTAEAVGWYDALADNSLYDLAYLAPAQLHHAQIADRAGQTAQAALHYQRFVSLWNDCDPELRPAVTDARRRLAQLRAATPAR
jgi:hypothetical protein